MAVDLAHEGPSLLSPRFEHFRCDPMLVEDPVVLLIGFHGHAYGCFIVLIGVVESRNFSGHREQPFAFVRE